MFEIRDATPGDAPELLEIAVALTEEAGGGKANVRIAATELARNIERGVAFSLIAQRGNQLAGIALYSFMHFSLSGEHLYLDDLYVAPEQRNQGLGRLFMTELAARARHRGCAGMTWMVEQENQAGIRFYKRPGASLSSERRIMTLVDLDSLKTA